jgi:hypothetical protein
MLKNVSLTHSEAQKNVLKFLNKDTILIGHSLENDLHALQVIIYYTFSQCSYFLFSPLSLIDIKFCRLFT